MIVFISLHHPALLLKARWCLPGASSAMFVLGNLQLCRLKTWIDEIERCRLTRSDKLGYQIYQDFVQIDLFMYVSLSLCMCMSMCMVSCNIIPCCGIILILYDMI